MDWEQQHGDSSTQGYKNTKTTRRTSLNHPPPKESSSTLSTNCTKQNLTQDFNINFCIRHSYLFIAIMKKQLQELKMESMQDRLDSLELRFEGLAGDFTHLSAYQLSKQCISCMEDIRSLAADCLIENTDRYFACFDRKEFIKYARDTRRSMSFDVDANDLIRCNSIDAGHHRQMTEEERGDRFISLKASVPPAKFCIPPYDAHELFVELAGNLRDFAIRELEYHDHPYVPHSNANSQPPPPYESQGRGLQYQGNSQPVVAAMPSVESSFASGASFVSIATEMSGDEESNEHHFKAWAEKQLKEHEKHLQRPVTPHVIADALHHYQNAQYDRSALPLGLQLYRLCPIEGGSGYWPKEAVIPDLATGRDSDSGFADGDIEVLTTTSGRLRDVNWDLGPVLAKDVPAPHPLLPEWMGAVQRHANEELKEFGLVVAWRYHGSEAWMDRYGHLIPQV
ncbi:hypothetical protein FPANT_11813 [Fusarium pseudoanthophilum]|uniref:Uncharacterized protein n=1 Tax=Fusarium pseudoanthophilum TaxID=48495 RepID=A0A8H5KI84_9HYPO|nr:hypothetical protein FPANT_11813 [Fusarium pseudoanthophilum]